MIDIETLSTKPTSAIVAIGAVQFDRETGDFKKEFYELISLKSAIQYGQVDGSTIKFWLQQPDEARLELTKSSQPLPETLEKLKKWLPRNPSNMWANGPSFDLVILETAYGRCKINTPWGFWDHRCFRTIKDIGQEMGVKYEKSVSSDDVLHNALDDAKRQANYVCEVYKALYGF